MADSVKRQLLINDEAQKSNEKESVFKLYKSAKEIGTQIKDDLLRDKTQIGQNKKYKDAYRFNISSDNESDGLIEKAYGIFLLANLLSGFNANFVVEEKKRLKNSFLYLLEYIQEHGYDVSPYADGQNDQIFKKNNISFIESLTWSFSCFLYAHRLQKKHREDFDFAERKEEIDDEIVNALDILIKNVIRFDGEKYELGYKEGATDYIGWGVVSGSKQPALYFTSSVCETYGDLEDTVIGNDAIDVERDDEYIEKLKAIAGYDIIGRFETICKIVGKNVYKKYESKIGREFFYEDGSIATTGQIEYSNQSSVLLNQLYAIMIPVYTNYHIAIEKEVEKNPDKDKLKTLHQKLKEGVDMVYKEYTRLHAKGKESIVNRDTVSFLGIIEDKKDARTLTNERINIAVLEALIVRARAMIVTYVTKYPEKELGEIVEIIEKNRSDETKWVWDNLQETERCVSALKEFFDYYQEYESKYATMSADVKELVDKLSSTEKTSENELKQAQDNERAARLESEERQKQIRTLEEQNKDLQNIIDKGSPIEKSITLAINETIKDQVAKTLSASFAKITRYNEIKADAFVHGKTVDEAELEKQLGLTEQDKLFQEAIDKYVRSYFAGAIKHMQAFSEMNGVSSLADEKVFSNAKDCMNVLMSKFMAFSCYEGAEDGVEKMFDYLHAHAELKPIKKLKK